MRANILETVTFSGILTDFADPPITGSTHQADPA
jgi:hypothetical protein